jgi:lipid II isoglutaminyl synthase (glutamine-hydrolysing)
MLNIILIIIGWIISYITKTFNLGNGSTWPGHIALNLNPNFIRDIVSVSKTKIIIVAGTNGKTTSAKLIATILKKNHKSVFQNESGANLLNGIASSLLLHCDRVGLLNYEYAIFEVDENVLPLLINEISPDYLIILNLFRDQLDRYGEVNTIANKWQKALKNLTNRTQLILNADDPQIAYLGLSNRTIEQLNNIYYFSCNNTPIKKNRRITKSDASESMVYTPEQTLDSKFRSNPRGINPKDLFAIALATADSIYCPRCNSKLIFNSVTFSHLGDWKCAKCGLKRPAKVYTSSSFYPLSGIYNMYNTNAAALVAKLEKIPENDIRSALQNFKPAFGRQEEIQINNKKIRIFLSKNPTGFNESLRTAKESGAKNILFVLNDRIPDGKDVSWIWDTDIEGILKFDEFIVLSGDRAYDLGLRIKYAVPSKFQMSNFKFQIINDLKEALNISLDHLKPNDTLYILPTYTAMLEVRKILTGRKIL